MKHLALLVTILCLVSSPLAWSQSDQPIFQPSHNIATDTPTPSATPTPEVPSEPLPLGWQIALWSAAAIATVALLYGATKAWHFANLFDRQYRFPTPKTARLRFGGRRCGGTMGKIRF